MPRRWSKPVRIKVGMGSAVDVTSNGQAAKMMMDEWPIPAGDKLLRARVAVLRSMQRPDELDALAAARAAFEAAAEEAHILLPTPLKS